MPLFTTHQARTVKGKRLYLNGIIFGKKKDVSPVISLGSCKDSFLLSSRKFSYVQVISVEKCSYIYRITQMHCARFFFSFILVRSKCWIAGNPNFIVPRFPLRGKKGGNKIWGSHQNFEIILSVIKCRKLYPKLTPRSPKSVRPIP